MQGSCQSFYAGLPFNRFCILAFSLSWGFLFVFNLGKIFLMFCCLGEYDSEAYFRCMSKLNGFDLWEAISGNNPAMNLQTVEKPSQENVSSIWRFPYYVIGVTDCLEEGRLLKGWDITFLTIYIGHRSQLHLIFVASVLNGTVLYPILKVCFCSNLVCQHLISRAILQKLGVLCVSLIEYTFFFII